MTCPPDSTSKETDYATVVYFTRYDLLQTSKDSITNVKSFRHINRIVMDTLHLKPGKYKFPGYAMGRNVCTLERGKYYIAEVKQARTYGRNTMFEVLSPKRARKVLNEPMFREALKGQNINEDNFEV